MKNSTEILLITPPFTQLNTPYPATAYLKGFLNEKNISSAQMDLGMETILALFSSNGLKTIFEKAPKKDLSDNSRRILALSTEYLSTIDDAIRFLQGQNPTLAYRIAERNFLPEAFRFSQLDDLDWAFGTLGIQDKAKYLTTLYLEDIGDFITENIDPNFGFSRYAERLGRSALIFDAIDELLQKKTTLIEDKMLSLLKRKIEDSQPKAIGFSVPFPGNLFAAFRCARFIKKNYPNVKLVLGGGFPNTELREISDPRVFTYFDFITLDDGERPILNLIRHLNGEISIDQLKRTFTCSKSTVTFINNPIDPDFAIRETGTPDYDGLPISQYLSVLELANPMHRLWSDGRWNKLTLAHGCYWGKCTFCDISLDYIQRYEPANAKLICNRVEEMIQKTGETGFHFVDEAAPPSLMKEFALEVLRRNLKITWWTNIRFEKSFTPDLCRLLQASGCIAVSGGLEVASDRLLKLIDKGVTVEQVAKVTSAFTDAGIMVHAYLMYGYPTQTVQETVDSLEMVRQLFDAGIVQSGFWHRFALTAHSPVGLNPEKFNIVITTKQKGSFANNDLEFIDKSGVDHELFSDGLKKSLYNYMHGIGFELPLQDWFDDGIPKTKVKKDYIAKIIAEPEFEPPKEHQRIFWLSGLPEFNEMGAKGEMLIFSKTETFRLKLKKVWFQWLKENLHLFLPIHSGMSFKECSDKFMKDTGEPFLLFYHSAEMDELRSIGLIVV